MKFIISFSCFILFSISISYSQSSPQTLLSKLKTANNKEKFNINLELARYYSEATPGEALTFSLAALDLSGKLKLNDNEIATMNNTVGTVYFYQEDYEKSAFYYEKELAYYIKVNDHKKVMESSFNLALTYSRDKRFRKAIKYYLQSLDESESFNDRDMQSRIYLELSECYFQLKKYENAYETFRKYTETLNLSQKISLLNANYKKVQTEKIATEKKVQGLTVDTAKKSKEINTLAKQNDEKSYRISLQDQTIQLQDRIMLEQKKRLMMIISFAVLVTLFLILLFRLYAQKKKANRILRTQKKEIEQQHKVIATKNQEITDSIHYARRIQTAILPQKDHLFKMTLDHFIYFEPRDIISGDFYWMDEKNDLLIIIAADCTGHGVPGAFMSMLGVTLLNEIILNKGITNPAHILNQLRDDMVRLLHQDIETQSTRDGMDISIVVIDRKKMKMFSAAAYNVLYVLRNDELIIIPADKMPIGMYYKMEPFNLNAFDLQPKDIIYLASDGFKDQFGGPEGKKFMSKNIKKLLLEIGQLSISEQKEMIENHFKKWRSNYEQNDDILVMGVKIIG